MCLQDRRAELAGLASTPQYRRLVAAAWRLLRDDDEACDCVQDAFAQALTHLAHFNGRSALFSWLYRITLNEALMRLRRRRRTEAVGTLDHLGGPAAPIHPAWPHDAPISPESAAQRREAVDLTRHGVSRLPPIARDVLWLRVIEDRTTRDAAARLGISEGAVKTRLHRAKQDLRDMLLPMGGQSAI